MVRDELELEKHVMDCLSADFPRPTSIQRYSHNRILISFGNWS